MRNPEDIIGAEHRLCFWREGARAPVQEFLRGLSRQDYRKVMALLQRTADHGLPLHNPEHAKQLKGTSKLFELKTHGVRIYLFPGHGSDWVLAHATKKKRDQTRREDIERALRVRQQWEEAHRRRGT